MNNVLKYLGSNNEAGNKMTKPDFTKKAGRELLAFYLRTKFKQIIAFDKKAEKSLFIDISDGFSDVLLRGLINEPDKRIMIAITGESASGKTTICRAIKKCVEDFKLPVSILTTDNYFNDISALIKKYGSFDLLRDHGYDVDSPDSFQIDLLREDLTKLSNGIDIKSPKYLINGTGVSVPNEIPVKSNKIIVVEGMSSLYSDLRDLFDVKIYIEIPEELRRERFIKRAADRFQTHENAIRHWRYVENAGNKYVKPLKKYCEIIASGECDLGYFRDILEYLKFITNDFCPQD